MQFETGIDSSARLFGCPALGCGSSGTNAQQRDCRRNQKSIDCKAMVLRDKVAMSIA
jgi:hypothetical protein